MAVVLKLQEGICLSVFNSVFADAHGFFTQARDMHFIEGKK